MSEPKDHEYRYITEYAESQVGAEVNVDFLQRVTVRRVLGEFHEVWDVHTSDGARWWVITNITNLYSQEEFRSFEMALTYHVGVKIMLSERSRKELKHSEDEEMLGSAWRRFGQAVDAFNQAQEAEEYQAVGVHCREALLGTVGRFRGSAWLRVDADAVPKEGDFKGWNQVFARSLTAGRPRRYVRALGEKTWDLAVALQHQSRATRWDAELVLDATHHYLGTLSLMVASIDRETDMCPLCGSYRVGGDLGWPEEAVMETWRVCGACEHQWGRKREDLT